MRRRHAAIAVSARPTGRRTELIAAYAEAGADHVTLALPTQPEAETLRTLDGFAALVSDYR
jgi:hypothetical protein